MADKDISLTFLLVRLRPIKPNQQINKILKKGYVWLALLNCFLKCYDRLTIQEQSQTFFVTFFKAGYVKEMFSVCAFLKSNCNNHTIESKFFTSKVFSVDSVLSDRVMERRHIHKRCFESFYPNIHSREKSGDQFDNEKWFPFFP